MGIASKQIIELTKHSNGCRARFDYIFDDDRHIIIGPINVSSQEDADSKLILLEPSILSQMQKRDANEAVSNDIKIAHKEASIQQVQYTWLKLGFEEDEPYKQYQMMKDIGPSLLNLGLTDVEYATMFNSTEEEVVNVKDLWISLVPHATVFDNYITTKEELE